MFKRIGGVLALAGLCALSVFFLSCGSSSSRPSGLLYVLSEEQSNVSSFAVDLGSGNLSLINSNATTCTTLATAPCGGPLQISLDPTGATAFVLNQGVPCVQGQTCVDPCGPQTIPPTQCVSIPPTIYGYSINSDGSLSAPATPVVWTRPLSSTDSQDDADIAVAMLRDAAGQFLFVVNEGSAPTQGNSYLANCPQVPTRNFDACPSISVFSTKPGATGATLTGNNCPQTNTPCPYRLSRIPTSLSAITYTPSGGSAQTLLFMTSSKDLTANHNDNELSVYSVDSSGNLAEAPNSPYTTEVNPTVVQAVNTSPPGQPTAGEIFVYVGNSGSSAGGVGAFELCSQVAPPSCRQSDVDNHLLFSVGTPTNVGQNPVAMVVDPTNSFLYIACNGANQVYGFSMGTSSGKLTALNPANQPTGSQPVALAMHGGINTNSEFLYASNNGSSNISGWPIVATTGSMGNAITVQFTPGAPSGMAGR